MSDEAKTPVRSFISWRLSVFAAACLIGVLSVYLFSPRAGGFKAVRVAISNPQAARSLTEAAEANDIERVKRLLADGASPNVQSESGFSALMFAVFRHNPEMLLALLDAGADVNDKADDLGGTALALAAKTNDVQMTRTLLERGADPNSQSLGGNTALNDTISFQPPASEADPQKKLEIIKLLLQYGANANGPDGSHAPLAEAVLEEEPETVRTLIAFGADVNAKDKPGFKPLHMAVLRKSAAIVNILIQHGVDVNALDNDNETPLQVAIDSRAGEIAALLRKAGAKRGDAPVKRRRRDCCVPVDFY